MSWWPIIWPLVAIILWAVESAVRMIWLGLHDRKLEGWELIGNIATLIFLLGTLLGVAGVVLWSN